MIGLSECIVPSMSVTQRGGGGKSECLCIYSIMPHVSMMSDQLPLHNQLFLNYIN